MFCFFGSLTNPVSRKAILAVHDNRDLFDDSRASFLGVSVDSQDEAENRVSDRMPGIRICWDFDQTVCKICGVVPEEADPETGPAAIRRMWIIVDPTLHVLATFPFADGEGSHEPVFRFLRRLRPPNDYAGFEIPAPVLILPNVVEP